MDETGLTNAKRTRAGPTDGDRLGALYDELLPVVYGFCRARLPIHDAEDVTAEVFSAAAERLASDPDADLRRAWFITAARNRIIDRWRREQRWDHRLRSVGSDLTGRTAAEPLPTDPVLEQLDRLSTAQRAAAVLHWMDGYPVREVAEILGRSEHAVESLLARARRRLTVLLEDRR